MEFPCTRCGKSVARPVWTMWHGRLARVGPDCAESIRAEKGAGGLGAVAPQGSRQGAKGAKDATRRVGDGR
jgi:hypothetical protein